MKKLFIIGLITSALLTACTSEEATDNVVVKRQITFSRPVLNGLSRAVPGEMPSTYDVNESFMVYGVRYPEGKYTKWDAATAEYAEFLGEQATHSGNTWDTQKAHFFKKGFDYAFAAYSPADAVLQTSEATSIRFENSGLEIKGFSPIADAAGQYDLMYAERVYGINGNTVLDLGTNGNATYDGVNLKFKHALASIRFKISVDPEYIRKVQGIVGSEIGEFQIKSIKIYNVYGTADFKEYVTDGIPYSSNPQWTNATNNTNVVYTAVPDGSYDVPVPDDCNKTLAETAQDIETLKYGHNCLLLPQTLPEGAYIEIKWKTNKHDDFVTTKTYLNNASKNPVVTSEWLLGHRYTYNIGLSADRIHFSPVVTDINNPSADIGM